jgi:ankyrin repeat protein
LDNTNDIKARNTHGDSPLLIALWNSSVHLTEELLHRLLLLGEGGSSGEEVDFTEALYLAANWSDIPENLFKKILDQSTDVNAKNEEGNTALHIALYKECKTATEQLLNRVKCEDGTFVEDVDVNLKGLGDNTALHLAVQWSDIPFQLFEKILGKSADVTAKNLNDKTPLQLAEECQLNKRAMRLLRRRLN